LNVETVIALSERDNLPFGIDISSLRRDANKTDVPELGQSLIWKTPLVGEIVPE